MTVLNMNFPLEEKPSTILYMSITPIPWNYRYTSTGFKNKIGNMPWKF